MSIKILLAAGEAIREIHLFIGDPGLANYDLRYRYNLTETISGCIYFSKSRCAFNEKTHLDPETAKEYLAKIRGRKAVEISYFGKNNP